MNVLLSLGSNVDAHRHITGAIMTIRSHFSAVVISPIYQTNAVGFHGPPFLNLAIQLNTSYAFTDLVAWIRALEKEHGRQRQAARLADRSLDVDIIFYGDQIIHEENLPQVPRLELDQSFVLKPLVDIAPDFCDPITGKTLMELWLEHPDYRKSFAAVSLRCDSK